MCTSLNAPKIRCIGYIPPNKNPGSSPGFLHSEISFTLHGYPYTKSPLNTGAAPRTMRTAWTLLV